MFQESQARGNNNSEVSREKLTELIRCLKYISNVIPVLKEENSMLTLRSTSECLVRAKL